MMAKESRTRFSVGGGDICAEHCWGLWDPFRVVFGGSGWVLRFVSGAWYPFPLLIDFPLQF